MLSFAAGQDRMPILHVPEAAEEVGANRVNKRSV